MIAGRINQRINFLLDNFTWWFLALQKNEANTHKKKKKGGSRPNFQGLYINETKTRFRVESFFVKKRLQDCGRDDADGTAKSPAGVVYKDISVL